MRESFDSNLIVVQSISIILFLLQINYNKYFGKITSFLGTLIFGVYLIHNNNNVKNSLNYLFDNESNNISLFSVYSLIMTKSLLFTYFLISSIYYGFNLTY